MVVRVVAGSARVLREIRAAVPLMAALRAPIPARAPWLTSVIHAGEVSGRRRGRPLAVLVEPDPLAGPAAVAFLRVRRDGVRAVVTLLGQESAPLPAGWPTARLYARDDAAAEELAAGIRGLLQTLRRPWALRLSGLPLGCPTAKALADLIPTAAFHSDRSSRVVDDLDDAGPVHRSTDPRALDLALPALLARLPTGRQRTFLRASARLHAAVGQLELAMPGQRGAPRTALLTLVDGAGRWPWWGFAGGRDLPTRMGSPLVSLTAGSERGVAW